jgi:hypothetical protein
MRFSVVNRKVRGGSWLFSAKLSRLDCYFMYGPRIRHDDIGFRYARRRS